jgi:hypothetical protein
MRASRRILSKDTTEGWMDGGGGEEREGERDGGGYAISVVLYQFIVIHGFALSLTLFLFVST